MRVTPALVQAAEAALRNALEPALALRSEAEHKSCTARACPRPETRSMCWK